MKTKAIWAACIVTATTLQAQTFDWVKSFGSSANDYGYSIAVDASGNIYTTGYFQGIVDFDPGAGTADLISAGLGDVFVQKLDASGNFLWAKSFGGSLVDIGYSIAVDASGNVYTIGYFQGIVDFDPGAGTANLTSAGGLDVFVQKLDASGNFQWAKSFGSTNNDAGLSIVLDTSGNVYTTGLFRDTVDFNPGLGTTYLTSAGDADVFVQKLDTSGNFQWAKSFGGGFSWDVGISIALDASGNVFTTGVFQGTADFDPGPGTAFLYSGGFEDVFIQKLDSSGNFLWANSFGGSFVDHGNSIAVDASGNVYSTGSYESEIGERRFIFIQKLDASGNVLWIKSFGGTLSNSGYSIVVDASGNIYTTGVFIGIVDFDPGAGIANLTSAGSSSYDVFVQKLDASGNFQWAKSFGGSYSDEGRSIALDASGNIYTTGVFRGSADFHLSAGTANLSSAGAADVFVYKMNPSTVGLLENTFAQQIKIFPNPTAGTFIIDLGDDYESTLITISDALGRVVSASKFSSTSAIQLSLDEPPGVYFIEIVSDDHSAMLKLIKE